MPGMGSPEMMQAAMDMMRNNPDMLRSALNMNPATAGLNSGMAEQVCFSEKMNNPENFFGKIDNPKLFSEKWKT